MRAFILESFDVATHMKGSEKMKGSMFRAFMWLIRLVTVGALIIAVLLSIGAVRFFADGATGSGIVLGIVAGAILFSFWVVVFKMKVFEPIQKERAWDD